MLSVVTWRWGTLYGPEYVNILRSMLDRHLHVPHRLFCVTDDASGLDGDIAVVPMPDLPWASFRCRRRLWHYDTDRIALFGTRMLHIDLDTVITDDITSLLDTDAPFKCWRADYATPTYSPAFALMTTGILNGLWDAYRADPVGYPEHTGVRDASDLAMLNHYLKPRFSPPYWDASDGFATYFGNGYGRYAHLGVSVMDETLPPGTRVVIMGGADKEALDTHSRAWIQEHWR